MPRPRETSLPIPLLQHRVGDKLLAQVAQRLQQVIGSNEQVGRLGGDEFAVVIRDASRTGYVAEVAQSIVRLALLQGGHERPG